MAQPSFPCASELGLGATNYFGTTAATTAPAEVEAAFKTSLDSGVNFFDTAEVYGNGLSEELLGQFLKKTTQPVQIATKFGPLPWRITGKSVSDALSASLKRLQVEQIALYQVHWPFTFLLSQETLMNALADEVKQGRIQAVGVSNYSAEQMREAHKILAARGVPLATNQVRYSLLSRQVEKQGIVSAARSLGVTILAYSPLAQGLLTGKYTAQEQPTGARKMDSRFSKSGIEKIELVMSTLRKMGKKRESHARPSSPQLANSPKQSNPNSRRQNRKTSPRKRRRIRLDFKPR